MVDTKDVILVTVSFAHNDFVRFFTTRSRFAEFRGQMKARVDLVTIPMNDGIEIDFNAEFIQKTIIRPVPSFSQARYADEYEDLEQCGFHVVEIREPY